MARFVAWTLATLLLAACSSSKDGGGGTAIYDVEAAPDGDHEVVTWDWGAGADGAPDTHAAGDTTGLSDVALAESDAPSPSDGAGDATPDTSVGPAWHLRIVPPTANGQVSATVMIRIEPIEQAELKVDSLEVSLGETVVFTDTKLPTEFVLDTAAYPNGALALSAEGVLLGMPATDALTLTATNPDFRVVEVSADRALVTDGAVLALDVDATKPGLTVTASFVDLDSGFAPEAGHLQDAGDGHYTLTYAISAANTVADGTYLVPVTVTDGVSTQTSKDLRVTLSNLPQNPLRLEGGIFVPGSVPPATLGWTPAVGAVTGNDVIITGGSATLAVDFSGAGALDEIVGLLVGVGGQSGYYQKPLDSTSGHEELLLLLRTYAEGETAPAKLPVQIALKDIRGRISPTTTRELDVQAVGNGDVQVSIAWDTATDVDLHVIEPGGCELYYSNKTCASGGWLDLDSNPACAIDNINHENVFWPTGQAPLGTYKVRVDFYDDCGDGLFGAGLPASYTVTLRYCGKIELVSGSFAAGSDDAGGGGDGVEVATFSNESCGRVLRGDLRFQDHVIDRSGTGARRWRPVRFATVEVVRAADDTVLATTTTDRRGHYEAFFSNTGAPGVYLRASTVTSYDDGLRKIKVMNHPKFKKVYAVTSAPLDETLTDEPVLDLDIPETSSAGAFNILDVVSDGYDTLRLMTGTDLGELAVYWATGADTTDTLFCSDYFYDQGTCPELNALSVQGKDTDRDEFDDLVILKEFFKFAEARSGRDDNPGGAHDGTRDDPRRSWSEGVSTFFACDAQGTRWFVNSRPAGVYLAWDLETIHSPFAFGATPGALDGQVSEYLVASVLWDLADGHTTETFDAVDGKRLPIYDAIFNYLPGDKFEDRGVPGVDLVDFLDGWFCRAWGDEANVLGLVNGTYLFPYTAGGPTSCFGGQ